MKRNTLFIIALLAITLSRCLFNMDIQDEGWVLTAYQNIFAHPNAVSYNFLYYNGVLVGGIWYKLFGGWGLLAFRLLYVLLEFLKALIVYLILRKYTNKWGILIGYALLTLCCAYYNYMDHNQLTSLLCLCAVFMLLRGLERRKWYYLFAAGIVVAINVFTRLPNLSLCALILVLIPFGINLKDNKQTWLLLAAAIGGFLVGCGLELILMCALGHLHIFFQNIYSGVAASADVDSTHNLLTIGQMTLLQWGEIGFHSAVFMLYIWAVGHLATTASNHPIKRIAITVCLSLLMLVFIAWQYQSALITRLYAIITIVCIYLIRRETPTLKHIAWAALIMAYTMPLGSDFGYSSSISYYAIALAFPLVTAYILEKIISQAFKKETFMLPMAFVLVVVIGVCDTYRLAKQSTMCFRYITQPEQRYLIHSPLANTFISNEQFLRLNPLLDELAKYADKGDTILCFQSMPMVHYLTQTLPYLENPWPWTYTAGDMEQHFLKAQAQSAHLPLVVREKGWALDILNIETYSDWDNAFAKETRYHNNKKIHLIQSFLHDNEYAVIWEDNAFQLLTPPRK